MSPMRTVVMVRFSIQLAASRSPIDRKNAKRGRSAWRPAGILLFQKFLVLLEHLIGRMLVGRQETQREALVGNLPEHLVEGAVNVGAVIHEGDEVPAIRVEFTLQLHEQRHI